MTTSNTRVTPLDPEQRAAAEAPVGPVLILGGPGAGKTHTLIARVGVLLKTGALPGDITCIAYNNWGAQDMLRRMLKTPEIAEQARKIRFRTIERCALEVLRRLGAEASPSLSVWPRQQVEHAIRDLASKLQSPSEPIFQKDRRRRRRNRHYNGRPADVAQPQPGTVAGACRKYPGHFDPGLECILRGKTQKRGGTSTTWSPWPSRRWRRAR